VSDLAGNNIRKFEAEVNQALRMPHLLCAIFLDEFDAMAPSAEVNHPLFTSPHILIFFGK
jgi:hypothetical protein